MKKLMGNILFDLVLWFCLYCMYMQNSYVDSAQLAVYILIGFKVALVSIGLLGVGLMKKGDVKKYNPPRLLHFIYGKVTGLAELFVLAVSGYLVCAMLYACCYLGTMHLHNKLMELKSE